ncbi:unnamed protein product [Amoebophrya sp. A120]|nr:unnamed protein product [Amoebophrya sp. A120]|eukprot:GSA120T00007119001.1
MEDAIGRICTAPGAEVPTVEKETRRNTSWEIWATSFVLTYRLRHYSDAKLQIRVSALAPPRERERKRGVYFCRSG